MEKNKDMTLWIRLPEPDKNGYVWIDNTTYIEKNLYEKAIKDFIKKTKLKIKFWDETSGSQ
jgi:hypothetical protein